MSAGLEGMAKASGDQGERKFTTSLFSRLLFYFLIVMIVPFILFLTYYFASSDITIENAIRQQAMTLLEKDSTDILTILDEYRHKGYVISSSETIVKLLEGESDEQMEKDAYNLLYNTMKGDTYLASANVVSEDGQIRISTHLFPEKYDLRTYSNEWDRTNILSIANQKAKSNSSSLISIEDHRNENGKQIFASILRRVLGEDGRMLGYVIIDIYTDAISPTVNSNALFSELIITDNTTFSAFSLLHPSRYGTFDDFPELMADNNVYSIGMAGTDFILHGVVEGELFTENLKNMTLILMISLIIGIAISILLSLVFSHSISRRIGTLTNSMKLIETGDFSAQIGRTGISDFDFLASSFNVMVRRIDQLIELTREEENKLREAERKQLESQMNPHFLFNTLNTIKALARLHGENDIYTISVRLGKLLRSNIDTHRSIETVKETLDIVESYLMIQKIRFPEKLHYRISCPDELKNAMIPRLILQPIVENSIVHGLEEKVGDDWQLDIDIRRDGDCLRISVKDNGKGFSTSDFSLKEADRNGHVGLYNVYRRLELRYGANRRFDIESKPGEYTLVVIEIPFEEEAKE